MKSFVTTKAFKAIAIVLGILIGASALSVAAVATVYSVRKTAVVVIPGILCSSLQDTETGEIYYDPLETDEHGYNFDDLSGDTMYGLIADIAVNTPIIKKLNDVLNEADGNFLDKFALDETGAPVYPTAAIQWDHDGYAKYGAMSVMRTPYEYFSEMYKNKRNYDVFVFQYDWRRDNRLSAAELVKATEKYDDVIIVAHSMGNIVTSLALAQSESFRKKVILNCAYAAPYYGSYSALSILEDGESTVDGLLNMAQDFISGNSFLEALFQKLLDQASYICHEKVLPYFRGMPGIVQLLPTIELVCPDGVTSNLTVNGEAITTREQLLAYYQSCFWAYEGGDLNGNMRSWAADLDEYWDSFYVDGVHASELVNTYKFAGYDIETNDSATVVKGEDGVVASFTMTTGAGDGTVPYRSATLGSEERVLKTAGYLHTELGIAIKEEMVTEQTKEAVKSIDNPFKVMANKNKYPLK